MKTAIFCSAILISGTLLQINGLEFSETDIEAAGTLLFIFITVDVAGFLFKGDR